VTVAIARQVALEVLMRVEADDAYANLLLNQLSTSKRLDSRNAALAQELAFGSLRRKNTLEAIINEVSSRPVADLDPGVRAVLQLGVYQLLYTRIPVHAALNESVEQSKAFAGGKASGLVNASLRKVAQNELDYWMHAILAKATNETERLALKYAHPAWIVTSLKLALNADGRSADLEHLLESDNEPARVNLVALPGQVDNAILADFEQHVSSPIGYLAPAGNPGEIPAVADGSMRVQDAGSQLVALVAAHGAKANESWLDLCAGPGGKAVLLAAVAKANDSVLTCVEPAPHRAELVRKALAASGLTAKVMQLDGRAVTGSFDRVLVDAPCTGLGALRRRPEARWRKSPSDLKELNALQKELIEAAWAALKPGGVLTYSTCSPHPSETTAIVEQALRKFGASAELLNSNAILSEIEPSLRLNPNRKTAQLWPDRDDTDAMFIAVIRKSEVV
jgi:16S rRNA (cytosine967-C5)-methyltransferase